MRAGGRRRDRAPFSRRTETPDVTDTTPAERRTRAVQERLRAHGDDAAVLFPSHNLQYTTGFSEEPGERHLLAFLPAEGDPVFLVPELSARQVRQASWIDDVRAWRDTDDPAEQVAAVVADLGLDGGHVLVDDTMHARFTQDLRAAAPRLTFGLASEVLAPLRIRKDDTELDALRRAAAAADATVADLRALGADAVGLTETELAERLTDRLATHGGTGVSFEPIVAAGPNGAMP
ncbi:MAG: Xaa-pro aminopeptidase, partial [halophilic archaeon J07HB67]